MEYFGTTVKKIREDKGFLSKEVYEGILSRSTAYRFEKDAANVTFSQLREILNRLNIFSLDEFVFLRRSWFSSSEVEDELFVEYKAIIYGRTPQRSLAFYEKYKNDERDQAKYYAYLVHIDYLIKTLRFEDDIISLLPIYKEEFSYIQNRLLGIAEWTMAELEAFPVASWIFDNTAKKILYRHCKNNFKKYRSFYEMNMWENKYIKLLLYYFIGQIYTGEYQELATDLKDLDVMYQNNNYLKLNDLQNYCLYLFTCGVRSASMLDFTAAQQYLSQFTKIHQALDDDQLSILNYYQHFFEQQIQKFKGNS